MNQSEAKKHLTGLKNIVKNYNAAMNEDRLIIEIKNEFNNHNKCRIEIKDQTINVIFEQFINKIAIYTHYHELNYYLTSLNNELILVVYN